MDEVVGAAEGAAPAEDAVVITRPANRSPTSAPPGHVNTIRDAARPSIPDVSNTQQSNTSGPAPICVRDSALIAATPHARITRHSHTLHGGDIMNSLSEHDINKALKDHVDTTKFTILPSNTSVANPDIKTELDAARSANKQILFAFWCRHHWVLCVCDTNNRAFFFDSAPSHPVTRDIRSFCKHNGLTPFFVPCPRQQRGSSECGIFVIAYAVLISSGQRPQPICRTTSLHHIRSLLSSGRRISTKDLRQLTELTASGINWSATHDMFEQQAASKNLCYILVAQIIVSAAREIDPPYILQRHQRREWRV